MKQIYTITNSVIILAFLVLVTGCSDNFLKEKKDYNGFNDEIYNDASLAQGKIDNIYGLCLPPVATGQGDDFSRSTEEFAGSSKFTQPTEITASSGLPDYFFVKNGGGPYSYIRECNLTLTGLINGTLPQGVKAALMGQVYFWRAWNYFNLVRQYGGVPIVLVAQDPILGDGGGVDLEVQRSSTADCIHQICADLDSAIAELPGTWGMSNLGRITSGAAAALKGRVLLTYASPQFNRSDDRARWQAAYDANLAAKNLLIANGFGLDGQGGNNAKAWGDMFANPASKEAVMEVLCNNKTSGSIPTKNNTWEQSARPADVKGGASLAPTANMVDAFPMADGKSPATSVYTYDPLKFYKNRDPRFYRTFAFNGVVWPFAGSANYTLWNYQWYKDQATLNAAVTSGSIGAGNAQYVKDISTGVYMRKRTNEKAVSSVSEFFKESATPYMEIRFAEVLLNLGESAVGIGKLGTADEGYLAMIQLRQRVGIPAGTDGLYGVPSGLDRFGLFREILNERKVELAYEGKRFWDMNRWMLWNDDPAEGNNTCRDLGVSPFNGARRTGIMLAAKTFFSSKQGEDYDVLNPASKSYDATQVTRDGASLDPNADAATFATQEAALDNFYDTNLKRIENDAVDPVKNPYFTVTFRSNYYFLGLTSSTLQQSPYLYQTVGWQDYYGGTGTFDPLK